MCVRAVKVLQPSAEAAVAMQAAFNEISEQSSPGIHLNRYHSIREYFDEKNPLPLSSELAHSTARL